MFYEGIDFYGWCVPGESGGKKMNEASKKRVGNGEKKGKKSS